MLGPITTPPRIWYGPAPWSHQVAAFDACVKLLSSPTTGPRRGLVVSPTGTGKSRTIRALVYWLISQGRRALVCLPTEEILDQLRSDFRRETRIPFSVEKAQEVASLSPRLTLTSHQTIWRRLHRYPAHTVVLFDESHHGNELATRNLSTLDRFDQVLGFTASPWSPECEGVYHGQVLYELPLSRAIADGFLCRYELLPFPDLDKVADRIGKLRALADDPRTPQHERAAAGARLEEALVSLRPGPFELYYCASNDEARTLAKACPAAAYLGHDTKDRDQVVSAFRAGRVRRVYLNRMLTEGFDCPEVSTIYIDKEPQSDILIYQMVGRGLRRKADGRGLTVYCRDVAGVAAALGRAG